MILPHTSRMGISGGRRQAKKHTAHPINIVNGRAAKKLTFYHHKGDDRRLNTMRGCTCRVDGLQREEQRQNKINQDRIAEQENQVAHLGFEISVQGIAPHQPDVFCLE